MKKLICSALAFAILLAAAPAFAAVSTQMWKCEMGDGATEEQVMNRAKEWLAKAKQLPGGENLKASVNFPVAVNFDDDADVIFTVQAPSFGEWGKFWDAYIESPAFAGDDNDEMIVCPDSALWETVAVE